MAEESADVVKANGGESQIRVENNDLDETLPPCRECERHFFAQTSTFNVFDAAIVLISMVTFAADIATDGLAASQYFVHGEPVWGCLTLGFMLVPALIIQVFSVRWYLADEDMTGWRWVFHCCLIGPVERYVTVFETGLEARRGRDPLDFERLHHQQSDVSMLRLFESFLESAPQVVLQLYIMVATNDENLFTGVAGTVSLFSLCWAVVAYGRAHRRVRTDKKGVSWPGAVLQTVWRIGMISSRVVALVLFASAFKAYTFLVVGLHWLAMVGWVYFQRTDFCDSWAEERLFNCVIGTVYVFCFFNLKEGHTRYRVGVFYLVVAAENVVLLLLWHRFGTLEDWYTFLGFTVVLGGFLVGIAAMVVYYRFFHPRGAIAFCFPAEVDKHDVCQHGKSNRLSALGRHGDANAEIYHRSRTPSPEKSTRIGRPVPRVERDPCPDGAGAPCDHSPLASQPGCPDGRAAAPPLRSQSLGCLLDVESERPCQCGAQLSANSKSSDCLAGEADKPSAPILSPVVNSPEPCTCSFQLYQLSGFATDLVDRYDGGQEAALARSSLADESKASLRSARSGAAAHKTPCRACLKFESGRSTRTKLANRLRSSSQPNTPSTVRGPEPVRPSPQVAVRIASSTRTSRTPTCQNAEIPEAENAVELSRVSADLAQMPDCIDSPETSGKLSAYQVQKIYDQILDRLPAPRISKRQLRFDEDLDDRKAKVGSSPPSGSGPATQSRTESAQQVNVQPEGDCGVNFTQCQPLLVPKTTAWPPSRKRQQKSEDSNAIPGPAYVHQPVDNESESCRDVSEENLTGTESKQPETIRGDVPQRAGTETACDSSPETENYGLCSELEIPGAETGIPCGEVGKPDPPNAADSQSPPEKSASSWRSVVPPVAGSGTDVEGSSAEPHTEEAEPSPGAPSATGPSEISQGVRGARNATRRERCARSPYDQTNPGPSGLPETRRSSCQATRPLRVSKAANASRGEDRINTPRSSDDTSSPASAPPAPIREYSGSANRRLGPSPANPDSKHLAGSVAGDITPKIDPPVKRAQSSNVLVASESANCRPVARPSPSSAHGLSPAPGPALSPKTTLGPGKENRPLTPLSARLALLSSPSHPSSPQRKPARKSLGRIPSNLVADNVALFNN